MKVYIIGAGPGDERYLTDYARDLILEASIVVTTRQLSEQLWHLNPNTVCEEVAELEDAVLDMRGEQTNVCVLVPGDTGFSSIAESLIACLKGENVSFECVNGINALQYFAAALNESYENAAIVNMQERKTLITPYVCYNRKVYVLTGETYGAQDVIAELDQAGLGKVTVSAGENLGAENERIVTDTAANLKKLAFARATVLLVKNDEFAASHELIDDVEFTGGAVPKQAVRRLSLNTLKIRPGDIVADIGAVDGSVSVEAARLAHRGKVFALVAAYGSAAQIKQNIAKFGAYNAAVINGCTPELLQDFPVLNKAFIGEACDDLPGIIDALLANNRDIKMVVNAVTLEALNVAMQTLKERGLNIDVMCVNVSVAATPNAYLMTAQNPVYIISAALKTNVKR